MTIRLAEAKHLIEAGERRATELATVASFAVVDDHGDLIANIRMDGARLFTPHVAYGKARVSALFRVPSAALASLATDQTFRFIDNLSGGSLVFLQGGVPILRDAAVVGAIGVSGAASSTQDEELAQFVAELAEKGHTIQH